MTRYNNTNEGIFVTNVVLMGLFHRFLLASLSRKVGAHNEADPTYFERIEGYLVFDEGDPLKPATECGQEPGWYKVEYSDCSWGVTLRFHNESAMIVSFGADRIYFDNLDRQFNYDVDVKNLREFMLEAMLSGTLQKKMPQPWPDLDVAAAERSAGWDASP